MAESERSRYKVEDLILSFISGSTAERWVLATESEEISLILGELCDLYPTLTYAAKIKLPKKQLSNVVNLIIIDLHKDDNSLRLNGLKLLRIITEDFSELIGNVMVQLSPLIQDFLQDNSRVIRYSAFKLISFVAVKVPFCITSSHIVTILESTYQFHEFCLKAASLGLLRFLDECQSPLTLHNRIVQQEAHVISFSRYSIALLQHSSSQSKKKPSISGKRDDYDTDSSNGDLIDGLYDAHDAALDLLALCCYALATVEGCKVGDEYLLHHLRHLSTSSLLHRTIEVADIDSLHKNAQSEILQRMKSFVFPSLLDDEIMEITRDLLDDLFESSDRDGSSISEVQTSFINLKMYSQEEAGKEVKSVFGSEKITTLACRSMEDDDVFKRNRSKRSIALERQPLEEEKYINIECANQCASPIVSDGGRLETESTVLDLSRLSAIKAQSHSRPSLQRSFSLVEKHDSNSDAMYSAGSQAKVSRVVQSADPLHRLEISANEIIATEGTGIDMYPPIEASTSSLFREYPVENGILSPQTISRNGTEDVRSNNYSRAASSRLKRSRLKQPPGNLIFEPNGNHEPTDSSATVQSSVENIADHYDFEATYSELMTPVRFKSSISYEPIVCDYEPPLDVTPKRRANHSTLRRKLKLESDAHHHQTSPRLNSESLNTLNSEENIRISFELGQSFPSGLKPDSVEYTNTNDLMVVKNPNQELSRALRGLESQDWSELFQTLNLIRRLVIHHSNIVSSSGSLHTITTAVMKLVDNLRSSLAKNALIAVADMFQGLKKGMDNELPTILPGILKRSADSSNFLGETAEKVLENMADYASAVRVLVALLGFVEHKTAGVRAKVAGCILQLLQRRCNELQGQRELESLKPRMGKLLQDQNPDTRSHAREIVKFLLHNAGMTRLELENFVPSELIDKALKEKLSLKTSFHSPLRALSTDASSVIVRSLEGESEGCSGMRKSSPELKGHDTIDGKMCNHCGGDNRSKTNGNEHTPSNPGRRKIMPPTFAESSGSNNGNSSSTAPKSNFSKRAGATLNATAAKRMLESDPELMHWQDVLLACGNSKNWIEKKDALTNLTHILIKHYSILRDVGKLETCLDGILDRLNDGSVKIIQHTLDCLDKISLDEPTIFQTNVLQIVTPKFLSAIASTNRQVSSRSLSLLMGILSSVSSIEVIQYLSAVAEHDQDKIRIAALKTLTEMMSRFCSDPDFINSGVKKIIFCSTCRIMFSDSSKVEIRLVCSELLKSIQTYVRQDRIFKWAESGNHQEEIKRITAGV